MAYKPFDAQKGEVLYRLIDPFCRFYLQYADKAASGDSYFWQHQVNSPALNSWSGIAFEELCMMHTEQIKRKLGISAVMTTESPYTLRGRLKSTQTIQLTFITTFGVKHNMYSGLVQSEVTLDDLFE